MTPEEVIVEVWRRELGSYVASRMLEHVASSTVAALREAGWELVNHGSRTHEPPTVRYCTETLVSASGSEHRVLARREAVAPWLVELNAQLQPQERH